MDALVRVVPGESAGKTIYFELHFSARDNLQPDAEELLHIVLAALEQNERFVGVFMSDDGRRLRERMRSIAVHVADRPEGNTCREIILGLYGMNDDYFGGVGVKRQEPVKLDWPIESGASKKQLQRQREILKRLRVWDEVRCAIVLVFVSMHWK